MEQMNKEIKSLTLMKDSELDTLETRLETYMQAEHEVALQLHEQKIKCSGEFDQFTLYKLTESDAEMEKNEMAAEIRNLKDALAEKQVSDVVMIDTELDQLLKSVEKSQVYIGYPHIGPVHFITIKIASFQVYSK